MKFLPDRKRRAGFFGVLPYFSFLLIGCISHFSPPGQPANKSSARNQLANTPPVSVNRQWRSATYRGLEVGKSTRQDMLRVLGKPKLSVIPQARITTNPNTIVAYHYGAQEGYSGEVIVGVEKAAGVIAWIETAPEHSFQEDMIKQFGSDYVLTGYKLDDCFIDDQPHYGMLYENPDEALSPLYSNMEYRQLGVAAQFRIPTEVYRVYYISEKWPYGNPTSLCNQPQKGLAYVACGCGCCGEPMKRQCLHRSKGDDLKAIVRRDKEEAKMAICAQVGCSFGIKYVYCD